MSELLTAAVLFTLSHLLPMHPPWRQALEARFGPRAFMAGYSLLSLFILVWLANAYADAPHLLLWPWYPWAAWVPVLVMPFACMLLVAGISSYNPFSLGLGAKNYNPERPGIVSVTRHPVMWGLALWSGAHIPVNGDLPAVVLFGLMLLLSLTGTLTIERNRRNKWPNNDWELFRKPTTNLPLGLCGRSTDRTDWRGIGYKRLLGGLALYALLLCFHRQWTGVDLSLLIGL